MEENGLLEEMLTGSLLFLCKPTREMRHGLAMSRGVVR